MEKQQQQGQPKNEKLKKTTTGLQHYKDEE